MHTYEPTTERVRMNDYVGPGIFAYVTWNVPCTDDKRHLLGLMSHTCTRCNAVPTITYEKGNR